MNYQCAYNTRFPSRECCFLEGPAPRNSMFLGESARQHILFHFMCRWTCSRCWRTVVKLACQAQLLGGQDISYVLIGPDHYLLQAQKFAANLGLPVTVLSENDQLLRQDYGAFVDEVNAHNQSLILVDPRGNLKYRARDPGSRELAQIMKYLPLMTFCNMS